MLFHGGIYNCIILPTTYVQDGKTLPVLVSENIVREVVVACDSLMQHAHAEDRGAVERMWGTREVAYLKRDEAAQAVAEEGLRRLGIRL